MGVELKMTAALAAIDFSNNSPRPSTTPPLRSTVSIHPPYHPKRLYLQLLITRVTVLRFISHHVRPLNFRLSHHPRKELYADNGCDLRFEKSVTKAESSVAAGFVIRKTNRKRMKIENHIVRLLYGSMRLRGERDSIVVDSRGEECLYYIRDGIVF